jgi:hypothetical protein
LDASRVGLVALVVHQRTVTGVSEPDVPIWVDDGIVWSIELFTIEFVGKNSSLSVVLVADDTAIPVFAGDLPALPIEGVSVAVSARVTKGADMAVFIKPSKLHVVGNVAPDEVFAYGVPCRSLGPQHVGMSVETLYGSVAQFVFVEALVVYDDVRIRVSRRDGARPVSGHANCSSQARSRSGEKGPASPSVSHVGG